MHHTNPQDLGMIAPVRMAVPIVPNDSVPVDTRIIGIYVGGTGSVAVRFNDQSTTFENVEQGTVLPIAPTHVLTASGATNMVALLGPSNA